jgi:hypothetical protein
MTDRFAGFVVTLEQDIREDNAEATIAAIKQIKGVADVRPVESSAEMQIAEQRARLDLAEKILKALA